MVLLLTDSLHLRKARRLFGALLGLVDESKLHNCGQSLCRTHIVDQQSLIVRKMTFQQNFNKFSHLRLFGDFFVSKHAVVEAGGGAGTQQLKQIDLRNFGCRFDRFSLQNAEIGGNCDHRVPHWLARIGFDLKRISQLVRYK